jgi:hypothetical protein
MGPQAAYHRYERRHSVSGATRVLYANSLQQLEFSAIRGCLKWRWEKPALAEKQQDATLFYRVINT